jgi:nicotinamidase-related amidase
MTPVLIIIDMQNDYFGQESLAAQRPHLAEAINQLSCAARECHCPVVWVVAQFAADRSDAFLEMKKRNISICIEGTEGAQLISELNVEPSDRTVIKKRYSAFFNTDLDTVLDELGATHLVLAGINTHACVRTTAIDAYQRDYEVILAEECIGSYDQEHHDVSWRYMNGKIGTGMRNAEIAALLAAVVE